MTEQQAHHRQNSLDVFVDFIDHLFRAKQYPKVYPFIPPFNVPDADLLEIGTELTTIDCDLTIFDWEAQ